MATPDPFDSTRMTIEDRRSQAQTHHDLALSTQDGQPHEPARHRFRFVIAIVMILVGAILLAMSDLLERRGSNAYELVRAAGWLLPLSSVFVVKPRSWRIPVYLVVTYFLVGMGSFSMYPIASIALHPQNLSAECRGWSGYQAAVAPIVDSVNARDARFSGGSYSSDALLRTAIADTEEIVRKLEALDPPGAMDDYHENILGMQRKWISVYRATQNGQATEDLLLDLHDDWVLISYLREQGNDKCASN